MGWRFHVVFLGILLAAIALLSCVGTHNTAEARFAGTAKPVIITADRDRYPLGLHLEVLEDKEKKWTLQDVASPSLSSQFAASRLERPNVGFTNSAYWVRFRIQNQRMQPADRTTSQVSGQVSGQVSDRDRVKNWYLEVEYPPLDFVQLFSPGEAGYSEKLLGDLLPFSSREIDYREPVFILPITLLTDRDIYLRFETSSSLVMGMTLWEESAFQDHRDREQFLLGLFYGFLILIGVYNLALFFLLQERGYLYASIFTAIVCLRFFAGDGLFGQYFFPENPWLCNVVLPVSSCVAATVGTSFIVVLLRLQTYTPRLYRIVKSLNLIWTVMIPVAAIASYRIVVPFIAIGVQGVGLLAIISTIAVWRQKHPLALFYLFCWLPCIAGIGLQSLTLFGILPATFWTLEYFRLSVALTLFLATLALAREASLFKQEREELQRLVGLDSLTQIANRRRFDRYLQQAWMDLARSRVPLSLIVCDVDAFKNFNDVYGHLSGDSCLQAIAHAIAQVVRNPYDLVARYGGEEFAVVLPDTEMREALIIAERIRESIRFLGIEHKGSQVSDRVTLSLGVATVIPEVFQAPTTLVELADKALYQAKHGGRDRVVAATECQTLLEKCSPD